jgi:flagellar motor switch protein FliM
MSSRKLLSENRIASLFERAAESDRPMDILNSGGRARWLRTIDFTRPTKFTPDQESRLRRAHDTFCRLAAAKLQAEHRIPMEIEIIDVVQLTFSDAHALCNRNAMTATLEVDPIGTKILLTMDVPLLLGSIERLLGSPSEGPPAERSLTEIDLMLVRRVFDTFVEALSTTWNQLAEEVSMKRLTLDVHTETAQTVGASEPTLAIEMEARMQGTTAKVAVLLPHRSVQQISAAYSKRSDADREADPESAAAVREGLGGVDITLRAEVGDVRMPVREVLALQPGDIIPLGIPADAAMALRADDVTLHHVRPGRHGRARAIQILGPAEGGT